jgi:hypothetical protein
VREVIRRWQSLLAYRVGDRRGSHQPLGEQAGKAEALL